MSLVVTVTALEPGAPLHAAVRLADALDARRVPLTLLVGARPHPEVVAWARARRRVGDLALLHDARDAREPADRPFRRLPAHEAGLRLAGALRARDAVGLDVDGFAAPGWAVSAGVREALGAAGVDLLVDDTGLYRLDADGSTHGAVRGPARKVTDAGNPIAPAAGGRLRRVRESARASTQGTSPRHHRLRHHTLTATDLGRRPGTVLGTLLADLDRDLEAGAVPWRPEALPVPRRTTRLRAVADPEHWSITA